MGSIAGVRARADKWKALRQHVAQETIPPNAPLTRTLDRTAPPKSAAGVLILQQDVLEANERVHELMTRLRALMCEANGMDFQVLDPASLDLSGKSQHRHGGETGGGAALGGAAYSLSDMLSLAGDIIQELRHHPEHVICAMACCSPAQPGAGASGNGMSLIAFTMVHRLLHPFSTDGSMTTALLLQGLNYQVEECANVEGLFPELDAKQLLARALFIADPAIALGWNPLAQPLPVVPSVPSETVLVCLLRMYAVRRDVTSFFRTVWRPILPQVVQVISASVSTQERGSTHTFANLTAVAYRLLEATLQDKVMLHFPPAATAICRAMFEIGGMDALHVYLFNLLVLPNLLKIFSGAHDSADNEGPVRLDSVDELTARYFDIDTWWPAEGFDEAPFSALGTLVWIVWRLYSAASMIESRTLAVLSTKAFFVGGPRLDMSGVPDTKLRSIIWHLQRRIEGGCRTLLRMPLDAPGSDYVAELLQSVGSRQHHTAAGSAADMRALEQRLAALINTAPVMLFMKGNPDQPRCGFSRQIVEILQTNQIPFSTFDILSDEEVRTGLKTYSDWPTYPQLYVSGTLTGGLDIVKEMVAQGDLKSQLGL